MISNFKSQISDFASQHSNFRSVIFDLKFPARLRPPSFVVEASQRGEQISHQVSPAKLRCRSKPTRRANFRSVIFDLKFQISNFKFPSSGSLAKLLPRCLLLSGLLSAAVVWGQDPAPFVPVPSLTESAPQETLAGDEKLRYGLSPYLADTNQDGLPDLQQVQQWNISLSSEEQTGWSVDWTPERTGTYRFVLDSKEPLQLKINEMVIAPYADHHYEVMGLLNEKTTLQVEPLNPLPPSSSLSATLTAFFIDGADADGDGLSMDWEMALHTDPAKADTDGDGLTDGEEVIRYHTDPTNADTNNNGIPDLVEVLTLPALFHIEKEGFWEEKMASMATRQPGNALLYRFTLPFPGSYRMGIVTHPSSTASGTIKFFLDGELKGEIPLTADPSKIYHRIDVDLEKPLTEVSGVPSLTHTIKVTWENAVTGTDPGELIIQQVYVDYVDNREEASPSE